MKSIIGLNIDRYHILEQIGEGGMAIVYKAFDPVLERYVAIKVLRSVLLTSKTISERFNREGKALASLSHPNIIQILDFGTYEGVPYFVMEFVEGGNLKQKLIGPMTIHDALQIILPLTEALQAAHDKGIIHRDIKPSNILITNDGKPMMSDFGIAKILENDATQELTSTGVGVGTPEYMAPEQGLGKEVDQRADIYSLGVVLFELLTGKKPYQADTPLAVLYMQVNDPLPRPSTINPNISTKIEKILFKAMAKDPKYRYPSMKAFAEALKQLETNDKSQQNRSKIIFVVGILLIIVIIFLISYYKNNIVQIKMDSEPYLVSDYTKTSIPTKLRLSTSTIENTKTSIITKTATKIITPSYSDAEWDVINHKEYYSIKTEFDRKIVNWIQINLYFDGGRLNPSNGSSIIGENRKLKERLFMIHLIQDYDNQGLLINGPEGSGLKNRKAENNFDSPQATYFIRDGSNPTIFPGIYSGKISNLLFDFEVLSIPSRYLILSPEFNIDSDGKVISIETSWFSIIKGEIHPISPEVAATFVQMYSYEIYGTGQSCAEGYPNKGELLRLDGKLPDVSIKVTCPIKYKDVKSIMGAYGAIDGGYYIYTFNK